MKTLQVTPEMFASKFGENEVITGSFEYFISNTQLGFRKDSLTNVTEVVSNGPLTEADEAIMENKDLIESLCGNFKPDLSIPLAKTLYDYEYDYTKSLRQVRVMYGVPILLTVLLVLYVLVKF